MNTIIVLLIIICFFVAGLLVAVKQGFNQLIAGLESLDKRLLELGKSGVGS